MTGYACGKLNISTIAADRADAAQVQAPGLRRLMSARKAYGRTASGKPIDDDLVDELAAKAEAGFDVEQTLRRRAGRPLIGSGPASVESVRLDPELRRALTDRAQRDDESTSSIIRNALRRYLRAS